MLSVVRLKNSSPNPDGEACHDAAHPFDPLERSGARQTMVPGPGRSHDRTSGPRALIKARAGQTLSLSL
jgi:hypothetical protein